MRRGSSEALSTRLDFRPVAMDFNIWLAVGDRQVCQSIPRRIGTPRVVRIWSINRRLIRVEACPGEL
jgi:hypothetical protein